MSRRESEIGAGARNERGVLDARAVSLACLKSTKFDRSVAEVPPPPKEKNAHDFEIECVEDLLDEACLIKEQRVKDAFEAGEPALDVTDHFYRCTSVVAHRS